MLDMVYFLYLNKIHHFLKNTMAQTNEEMSQPEVSKLTAHFLELMDDDYAQQQWERRSRSETAMKAFILENLCPNSEKLTHLYEQMIGNQILFELKQARKKNILELLERKTPLELRSLSKSVELLEPFSENPFKEDMANPLLEAIAKTQPKPNESKKSNPITEKEMKEVVASNLFSSIEEAIALYFKILQYQSPKQYNRLMHMDEAQLEWWYKQGGVYQEVRMLRLVKEEPQKPSQTPSPEVESPQRDRRPPASSGQKRREAPKATMADWNRAFEKASQDANQELEAARKRVESAEKNLGRAINDVLHELENEKRRTEALEEKLSRGIEVLEVGLSQVEEQVSRGMKAAEEGVSQGIQILEKTAAPQLERAASLGRKALGWLEKRVNKQGK